MPILSVYEEFIQRVDQLGLMTLSPSLPGLPSLGEETTPDQWHTGAETDPWQWKDRAAAEKRLAYGCILGGHKGFVSGELYGAFYAACHPTAAMPERWEAGAVRKEAWDLWTYFESNPLASTAEIRRALGVSRASGAGRLDAALEQLEREFYITTAGTRRKIARGGQPFGWPATVYDRVTAWAPPAWLRDAAGMQPREGRALILDAAARMNPAPDLADLARFLMI